jgi:hypothetical protein
MQLEGRMRACAAASAAAVASLLAIAACGSGDDRVVAPDVAGLHPDAAAERICDAGLTWTPEVNQGVGQGLRPKEIVARLKATGSTPTAGTMVEEETQVVVLIDSPSPAAALFATACP